MENNGNNNGNENSGNTIGRVFRKKVRNAILTLQKSKFDKTDKIVNYLEHYKAFKYILICEHDGPSEEHRHIYVQYNNARTLDSRYLEGCHLEEALGSAQKCIEYLKAEDNKHIAVGVNSTVIYENGEPTLKGNLNTISQLKEISDINDVPVRHLNAWQKVKNNKIKIEDWKKKIKVIYIWGPSGIGKSLSVIRTLIFNDESEFDEVKHVGDFWHGIGGDCVEGVAVYDDFRDSDLKASEFINFIDYNIHNLNYKEGSAKNKYNLIIITSIQDPKNIYKGVKEKTKKQWLRRMKIINLNNIHVYNEDHDDLFDNLELV